MSDIWMLLLFVFVAIAGPILGTKLRSDDLQEEFDESFAEQVIAADGLSVAAKELVVLHREWGPISKDKSGATSMDAQWLCRSAHGTFLLGIAQGSTEKGRLVVSWTWRHLTEERAKHALLHDPKAYRAVFGE
jgi:hypothetical protein